MNDLVDKLADLNVNIDSQSAVQIAEMWRDVQYFRFGLLGAFLILLTVGIIIGIIALNRS